MAHTVVMCICNKGGATKSTVATTLAHTTSVMTDKQVLFIDLDPQGNGSSGMGVTADKWDGSLHALLTGQADLHQVRRPLKDVTSWSADGVDVPIPDNLWVVPSPPTPGTKTQVGAGGMALAYRLDDVLQEECDDDWFVVIDIGPDMSPLTPAGLVAATDVIIPAVPLGADYEGALKMYPLIDQEVRRVNPDLNFAGMVFNKKELRSTATDQRLILEGARKADLKGGVFDTEVPVGTRVSTAYTKHLPATAYAPEDNAVSKLADVAVEFLTTRSAAARSGRPIELVRTDLPTIVTA